MVDVCCLGIGQLCVWVKEGNSTYECLVYLSHSKSTDLEAVSLPLYGKKSIDLKMSVKCHMFVVCCLFCMLMWVTISGFQGVFSSGVCLCLSRVSLVLLQSAFFLV